MWKYSVEVLYAQESEINLFATADSYYDRILLFDNNVKVMSRLETFNSIFL